MFRRKWIAIPVLAAGVLLMLLAGAQDTRGAQASLDELLQSDGMTQEQMAVHLLRALDDWVPFSTACPGWGGFSDDDMCLSGASTTTQGPGGLVRGGDFNDGSLAGPFAVGGFQPSLSFSGVGFRGAR